MKSNQDKHAVGLFSNRKVAEQAIRELKETGFSMSQVSVLTKDPDQTKQIHRKDIAKTTISRSEGATTGAVEGATTGGLLALAGGIAALLIPGIGLALAAESVLTVLLGSAAVAVSGGLVGALRGWFVPEEQAAYYRDRIVQGDYLVIIEGTEVEIRLAERILGNWGIQEWKIFPSSPS